MACRELMLDAVAVAVASVVDAARAATRLTCLAARQLAYNGRASMLTHCILH